MTSLGDIDLLGEIPGGGTYEDLVADAIELHVFRIHCLCLILPNSSGRSARPGGQKISKR